MCSCSRNHSADLSFSGHWYSNTWATSSHLTSNRPQNLNMQFVTQCDIMLKQKSSQESTNWCKDLKTKKDFGTFLCFLYYAMFMLWPIIHLAIGNNQNKKFQVRIMKRKNTNVYTCYKNISTARLVSSLTHATQETQGFMQALRTQRKVYASNKRSKTRKRNRTHSIWHKPHYVTNSSHVMGYFLRTLCSSCKTLRCLYYIGCMHCVRLELH